MAPRLTLKNINKMKFFIIPAQQNSPTANRYSRQTYRFPYVFGDVSCTLRQEDMARRHKSQKAHCRTVVTLPIPPAPDALPSWIQTLLNPDFMRKRTRMTMAPVRIFLSSPSDLRPERAAALRLIARLNSEFAHHFRVEAVSFRRALLRWRHVAGPIIWDACLATADSQAETAASNMMSKRYWGRTVGKA
jgi:hypothetical protein